MNIITNETLIKRMGIVAQACMFSGLAVLVGGMVLSFNDPAKYFYLSLVSLILGFILSQVGINYSTKFGRTPRTYEMINQALKGMDRKNTLYHYMSPVPHLLVGPIGVWILMPRHQRGRITYENGRWKQKGSNLYLKFFAQDNIGRVDLDIQSEKDKLLALFKKHIPEEELPPIYTAVIFTNPNATIDIPEDSQSDVITVKINELKDALRKDNKVKQLPATKVQQIVDLLPDESQ